jgi:hypothetical protein
MLLKVIPETREKYDLCVNVKESWGVNETPTAWLTSTISEPLTFAARLAVRVPATVKLGAAGKVLSTAMSLMTARVVALFVNSGTVAPPANAGASIVAL